MATPTCVTRAFEARGAELDAFDVCVNGRHGGIFSKIRLEPGALLRIDHATCSAIKPMFPQADAWNSARYSGSDERGDTMWHLESPLARAVRHSPSPNMRVFRAPNGDYSIVIILKAVPAESELLRDHFEPVILNSVSKASAALELLPTAMWSDTNSREQLFDAVQAASASVLQAARSESTKPAVGVARGSGKSVPLPFTPEQPVVLFTDYPILAKHARREGFQVVTKQGDEALSALWLIAPFKQWRDLPPGLLINQFPYEGALVKKDLLAITARTTHAVMLKEHGQSLRLSDDVSDDVVFASQFPPWCPVTFDLATEAHLLSRFHAARKAASGAAPKWIVKLAGGTHSSDPCITDDIACVMKYALSAPGGDRIAQAYETAPVLLCGGRKFDMRVYVAVRDFQPLAAAVHCGYYGRVAPARYEPEAGEDSGAHYTVSWYGDGPQSTLLDTPALVAAATEAGLDWEGGIHPAIVRAITELFAGAGRHFIGHWPYNRGLYGVDVLLGWREPASPGPSAPQDAAGGSSVGSGVEGPRVVQPLILEVNFAGDLQTLLERVPHAAAAAKAHQAAAGGDAGASGESAGGGELGGETSHGLPPPTFVDEALTYLFTDEGLPQGWEAIA